ncbi:hypothetical protein T310_8649, partial [Rasamsonia emersonii CBS 393.64]
GCRRGGGRPLRCCGSACWGRGCSGPACRGDTGDRGAQLRGQRGRRLSASSRRDPALSRRRRTRGPGPWARARQSRHCGRGCSNGDRSHRGRWLEWRFALLILWEGEFDGIPGLISR